jgi:protein tyrosine/serine phosphatase
LINFRDFGGYATESGAQVRRDQLYRCGHLAQLNDEELEHIIGLDFALIADLRYAGERESERSPWPSSYLERVISHDGRRTSEAPHMALFEAGAHGVKAVDEFYAKFYRDLPFDRLYQPLFAATMRRMAKISGRALIHCAAGKDRTGIQAALILHVLGVPRAAIIDDYLRSSKAPSLVALKSGIIGRFEARYGLTLSDAAADALLDVKAEYIEAAFAEIEARCGSVEAYLDRSGVDRSVREQLRERLVRDAD